jgi:hypothetical protein
MARSAAQPSALMGEAKGKEGMDGFVCIRKEKVKGGDVWL